MSALMQRGNQGDAMSKPMSREATSTHPRSSPRTLRVPGPVAATDRGKGEDDDEEHGDDGKVCWQQGVSSTRQQHGSITSYNCYTLPSKSTHDPSNRWLSSVAQAGSMAPPNPRRVGVSAVAAQMGCF